jgi:hypothetical protein
MKTRTLLLLSVATALTILLAGGVFLVQLAGQDEAVDVLAVGGSATVGDLELTVLDASEVDGTFSLEVEIGGVDDPDGIAGLRLVTGDRRLEPQVAPAPGRCGAVTVEVARCVVDFDVSAADSSSRVLVVRRGDEQVNWRLS